MKDTQVLLPAPSNFGLPTGLGAAGEAGLSQMGDTRQGSRPA
jgi:hypothetical protein